LQENEMTDWRQFVVQQNTQLIAVWDQDYDRGKMEENKYSSK
jgi:hypothetical protein